MSQTSRDAIVVGGGVSGLVAASYLARAGLRVVVVEARPFLGGMCALRSMQTNRSAPLADLIYALDRRVIEQLGLARRGLRFAVRDLPLVGLRQGGRHIVLGRNPHAAASFIRPHSERDAKCYARFRRLQFAQARAARRMWWSGAKSTNANDPLRHLSFLGASALLDSWFESDALKATLAFDATADGVSIEEPPSALMLLWRAAQENAGLQSASGVLRGGSSAFVTALSESAGTAGAELRTSACAARLLVRDAAIAGVVLDSGEEIAAPLVLSSLSRRSSYALLPPAEAGIGETLLRTPSEVSAAQFWLALETVPDVGGTFSVASRFIVAERLENFVAAHEASRSGLMPSDVPFEAVGLPANGRFELSILARPVPRHIKGGWKTAGVVLLARIVASLSKFDRGIKDRIRDVRISTPDDLFELQGAPSESSRVERLLGRTRARVETPVHGFYLCGADTEPVSSISGRAARMAAGLAIAKHNAGTEGVAA